MWPVAALTYLTVGLAAAIVTLAVFRPLPGHRPRLWLLGLALLTFTLLWPFLLSMGLVYLLLITYDAIRFKRPVKAPAAVRLRRRLSHPALREETRQ
jgi:hypothetical protein